MIRVPLPEDFFDITYYRRMIEIQTRLDELDRIAEEHKLEVTIRVRMQAIRDLNEGRLPTVRRRDAA